MKNFKILLKLTLQVMFVIIFFSTVEAKNPDNLAKGKNISNYFSGILSLNSNQYDDAYRYFNKLNNLERDHLSFSKKQLYTLVNLGKIEEAFYFSKKLEKKNIDTFESNLIIGIYYLKNEKYDLSKK